MTKSLLAPIVSGTVLGVVLGAAMWFYVYNSGSVTSIINGELDPGRRTPGDVIEVFDRETAVRTRYGLTPPSDPVLVSDIQPATPSK